MSGKLLVIEDELRLARYLQQGLTEAGYSVEVANDGDVTALAGAMGLSLDAPPPTVLEDGADHRQLPVLALPGSALALAVQPTDGWRELWVFRRSGAGRGTPSPYRYPGQCPRAAPQSAIPSRLTATSAVRAASGVVTGPLPLKRSSAR